MRECGFRVHRPHLVAVRKLGTACFFLDSLFFYVEMSWKSNFMERKLYFLILNPPCPTVPRASRQDLILTPFPFSCVCCENWLANGPPAIFILDRPLGTSSRSERLR